MKVKKYINVDYQFDPTIVEKLNILSHKIVEQHSVINDRTGLGNSFLGWLDLPFEFPKTEEYSRILETSKRIQSNSKVLVVIGIGGSYLGTKAGYELFKNPFKKSKCELVFAGHQLSGKYMSELLSYLKNKDYSINVISKSGTTTEPAVAFRIIYNALVSKYGETIARSRVIATTDQNKGALHDLSIQKGFELFVVPDNVGGRFSVLTSVGLLPLSVAGIDINKVIDGARLAKEETSSEDVFKNPAYFYAASRYLLYNAGKKIEILVNYNPEFAYFSEWWKQLFGESEGKNNKGLFVSSLNFTTDLHSMGQYMQEGERKLFETVIKVKKLPKDTVIPLDNDNLDELNYLYGKTMNEVNNVALEATVSAHEDGDCPNIVITVPKLDYKTFGYLIYFFEISCAMSAYLLGVNPFNQPGVEAYKKKMFQLLGKNK